MEYLALMGGDLKSTLSASLGQHAAFFWGVIAPAGLLLIWAGSLYALWESWFRDSGMKETRGSLILKLLFTVMMISLMLISGTALEYLVFGGGLAHARVLGGVVNLLRPH